MRIRTKRQIEEGTSILRIEEEQLRRRARLDLDERSEQRTRSIRIFNSNSERLYNVPGNLVIDLKQTGFSFDVQIKGSGSTGIDSMKVFCYDLTLAELWSTRKPSPGFLIHDSIMFDPVDEWQRAIALEMAAEKSEQNHYQYICTINSDMLPQSEFSSTSTSSSMSSLRSLTPSRRAASSDSVTRDPSSQIELYKNIIFIIRRENNYAFRVDPQGQLAADSPADHCEQPRAQPLECAGEDRVAGQRGKSRLRISGMQRPTSGDGHLTPPEIIVSFRQACKNCPPHAGLGGRPMDVREANGSAGVASGLWRGEAGSRWPPVKRAVDYLSLAAGMRPHGASRGFRAMKPIRSASRMAEHHVTTSSLGKSHVVTASITTLRQLSMSSVIRPSSLISTW